MSKDAAGIIIPGPMDDVKEQGDGREAKYCKKYKQPEEWTEAEKLWDRPSDKKYDAGKPMVGQMEDDFPLALLEIAKVTRYGIEKYKEPGSWKNVDEAFSRYKDALGRHRLLSGVEDKDEESGHLHLAHHAWNALAILELYLMVEE